MGATPATCPKCRAAANQFVSETEVVPAGGLLTPGATTRQALPCGCALTTAEFEAACREYVDR